MKILHVANWCAGVHERNVRALKQFSTHSHEFVCRIAHPLDIAYEAPTYTEAATSRETVLALAEEADALHFHAVGYAGAQGFPETIHGIDWGQFRGKKRFILTGHCSTLDEKGRNWVPPDDRFRIPDLNHYDAIFGPHLSCRFTYSERLQYAPDIIPIFDWLYTPAPGAKPAKVCAFKGGKKLVGALRSFGIDFERFETPTRMAEQLRRRRTGYRATLDNFNEGHWGLFGMESLAQGIPSCTYIHPANRECFEILKAPATPFVGIGFAGPDLPDKLTRLVTMPEDEWQALSRDCRAWIERHYDPERLVWRWDSLYDQVA